MAQDPERPVYPKLGPDQADRIFVPRLKPGKVVVTTPSITLVTPIDAAERVRELVALVRAEAGGDYV